MTLLWGSSNNNTTTNGSDTSERKDYHERDLERRHSQNDPTASASAAAGTAWLAGHLHHLTDEQEEKLTAFKKLCEERGYYKSEGSGEGGKASHTDETMLYVSYLFLSLGLFVRGY